MYIADCLLFDDINLSCKIFPLPFIKYFTAQRKWPRNGSKSYTPRMNHRQPKLTVCVNNLYINLYKDFVLELLDQVIYKTLYGNPLHFLKLYDIVIDDEIKLTYLLFSVYLSVLCRAIWSHNGPKLQYTV